MSSNLTLWRHARIYNIASSDIHCIEDGALIAKNGVIQWVGETCDVNEKSIAMATTIVDCDGLALLPGFIDCHTHLVYAGNRHAEFEARLQGEDYVKIAKQGGGILSTVIATRAASSQSLYNQSAKRLKSMIAQGVTTVEIKSGYGLDLQTEQKMLQVALQLGQNFNVGVSKTFLGAHALPPEFSDKHTYIAYIMEKMLPALAKLNLVDAVDAFCENIAFDAEQVESLFKACQALNLKVKCHADQLSQMGASRLAAKYQALSVDHLEYTSATDIQAIKQSDTVAVLLPGAYYCLQTLKKPPVEVLRAQGVPMAVATDCNPGTSPVNSLLIMMNMACTLFGLSTHEVLKGVTVNAAKALGLSHVGQLQPGFQADCVLWDIDSPKDLIYQLGINDCHAVFVKGVKVYDRKR